MLHTGSSRYTSVQLARKLAYPGYPPHILPHKCTVLSSSPTQSTVGEIVASNLGSSREIAWGKVPEFSVIFM